MTALSVNVNKIATLRNSRGHNTPCLIDWCHKIVCYGAQGITLHPRADQRHITPQDVAVVSKEITKVELNLEGDLREEFLELVLKFKPAQCTLVPVFPGEVTSNHGWNCKKWGFLLKPIVKKIKSEGIRVCLFVEANDLENLNYVKDIEADRIEIFTEPYAAAFKKGNAEVELNHIKNLVKLATSLGIGVNAGHDLSTENLPSLLTVAPEILEVSIGHQLICDSLDWGMEATIQRYLSALKTNPKI